MLMRTLRENKTRVVLLLGASCLLLLGVVRPVACQVGLEGRKLSWAWVSAMQD